MSLLNIAAELFIKQLGSNAGGLNIATVTRALGALLPTQGGELNLAALVQQFTAQNGGKGGEISALVSGWIGGSADNLNLEQLFSVLGKTKVDNFAQEVGVANDTAASGLAAIIPELISKHGNSSELLGSLASSAAKNILGKLF